MQTVDVVGAVELLASRIGEAAPQAEADRTMPREIVDALIDTGIFRTCVPRSAGGLETDVVTLLAAVEAIASADGSAGWVAMIGATTGFSSGFMEPPAVREVFGDPRSVAGGMFTPKGTAVPADGGWRCS